MSSIFSTQKRQTFLRRKYCFLVTAAALSPPVGRCEAAMGLPPFCSAIMRSPYLPSHPKRWDEPARDERVQDGQAPQPMVLPAKLLQAKPLQAKPLQAK